MLAQSTSISQPELPDASHCAMPHSCALFWKEPTAFTLHKTHIAQKRMGLVHTCSTLLTVWMQQILKVCTLQLLCTKQAGQVKQHRHCSAEHSCTWKTRMVATAMIDATPSASSWRAHVPLTWLLLSSPHSPLWHQAREMCGGPDRVWSRNGQKNRIPRPGINRSGE